jgi:hypothetical protein
MSEDGITEEMLDEIAIQRCLRQFHGDWHMNILWLKEQAELDVRFQDDLKRALGLMERDREEALCEQKLVEKIMDTIDELGREDLIDLLRYCEILVRARGKNHDAKSKACNEGEGFVEWWADVETDVS